MIKYNELFKLNGIRVKDQNKALIYDLILNAKVRSRKDILKGYHIKPNILTKAVKELLIDGLIYEDKSQSFRVGRPEIILKPNLNRLVAISMYIESRELKCALVNLGSNILNMEIINLPKEITNIEFLVLCKQMINTLLKSKPESAELGGIGISLPGHIDPEKKCWLSTYRWPKIKNLDISCLGIEYCCNLYIKKDLDSILDYYLQKEESFRRGITLLFHWGFGVGFALAQNGVNMNYNFSRFGEIGHTRINLNSKKSCICGSKGCIETETAIWALLPALRQIDSSLIDDESIVLQFCEKYKNISNLKIIKNAIDIATTCFINLYRLFYPNNVLLLGPFFAIPKINQHFKLKIEKEIKDYGGKYLKYFLIPDGYKGCIFANVNYILQEKLRNMLKASF